MGAGATIPASVEEAVAKGFTKIEIDQYLLAHPEARVAARAAAEVASDNARDRGGERKNDGKEQLTSMEEQTSREHHMKEHTQRVEAAQKLFDRHEGNFDTLAEELPCTNAVKMQEYVENKLRQYRDHDVENGGDIHDGKYAEYRKPSYVWARAHAEGIFYD
jgi:hypothetical protein